MTNIPTELLRTFMAVVDLRSFTKAAQSLGVTQPAVSAQIKRLQYLLGVELFDKRAPGVSLSPVGEVVVNYARRMLSINDQILDLADTRPASQFLRVGMTGDYAAPAIAPVLKRFRKDYPDLRYSFLCRTFDALIQGLREGDLDVVVGLSANGHPPEAHRSWTEEVCWVQAADGNIDPDRPVPLVSYGEDCAFHRAAITALTHAGRESESVFVGSTIASIVAMVAAGMGVTALPAGHTAWPGVVVSRDPALPKPAEVFCSVYLREGGGRRALREALADAIESALRPRPVTSVKPLATVMSGDRTA